MWQAVAGILAASVTVAAFQMVYENYSKSVGDSKTSDKVAQIAAGQDKDKSGAHTKKWKAPLWKIGSKLRK